ncbi:MAG: hypothetical protein RIF46_01655 [Cyclobacteriaceae bacterium]
MSKQSAISRRKKELSDKEKILLGDLDEKGSKIKKIALWSLGAGLVVLIIYGVYRSFAPESKKKKSKKKDKSPPKNNEFIDSAIEQIGPKIGNWILREFKR